MRNLLLTFSAAALGAALYAPTPAAACVNDYDAWGWLQAWETQDDEITELWCHDQATLNGYWNALRLFDGDGSDWNYLSGGNSCNPDTHFARVMNGAVMLDQVYYNLLNTTLEQAAYYWLGEHVSPHSAQGWKAGCNYNPADQSHTVASNPSDDSTPNNLYYFFFWKQGANKRGSTLVHECVHDWVGHIDAAQCANKCGTSCDPAFGPSNAQTWDVTYLDHSIATYRRAAGSDQLDVAHMGDLLGTGVPVCGYIPLLSPLARREAIDVMNWKIDSCFATAVSADPVTAGFTWSTDPFWEYGDYEYGYDKMVGARWNCDEICDASAWGSKCDPAFQPGNAAVNTFNQALCNEENSQLHEGVTPQEWAHLMADFNKRKQGCVPGYSDTYLTAYCDSVSGSAANVAAIESAWDLADQAGAFDSGAAMLDCVQDYCQGQFSAQWANDARAACYEWDDSLGCLDAICGSLASLSADFGATSEQYFLAVQCRRHFIDNGGDASEYLDAGANQHHCDKVYTDCRNAAAHADWLVAQGLGECNLVVDGVATTEHTYGLSGIASIKDYPSYARFAVPNAGVKIDECVAVQQACEATEAMLHKIIAEMLAVSRVPYGIDRLQNLPDPPPYDVQNEAFQSVRQLVGYANQSPLAGGPMTPAQAIERLRHLPEANQALSIALGQQLYFSVLGADSARESVFGAAKIRAFEGAAMPVDPIETSEQAAVKVRLAAGKATREKLGSETAVALYQQATATNMEAFFTYLKALQTGTSLAEVDAAYDALDAAM